MILTFSAPRRPARRRLATAATAGLVAGLLSAGLLSAGLGSGASFAATATPSPSPSTSPEPATSPLTRAAVDLTFTPVGNGVVDAGSNLTMSIGLTNRTSDVLAGGEVTVRLGSTPIGDRDALTRWLADDATGARLSEVGSTTFEPLADGELQVRGVTVDADSRALEGRAPGIYPLLASLDTEDGTVRATSVIVIPDADAEPVDVALVVPITAGARTGALIGSEELAELTAPGGGLAAQLDAVDGTGAILAVDPAILASIRVLGSAAPETALTWLQRFEQLPNERFALQFGDADVAVQLAAGANAPLRPRALTAFLDPEDFTAGPTLAPTASALDENGLPQLPALLDVGEAIDDVYWPARGAAPAETVDVLGDLGDGDRASTTLLASRATSQGQSGRTVPAHATAGEAAGALVYDSDISALLSDAAAVDETLPRGAALTAATAHLTFASAQSGGRPLALALDRSISRSRVGLGTALTAVAQAPGIRIAQWDAVGAAPARDVDLVELEVDEERRQAASALFAAEEDLARFATILDDASLLTGPERGEILQLLGTAWIAQPFAFDVAVSEHRLSTRATIGSVELLPTSDITLAGSSADLRFWVRNDLPYPVELVLYAAPDDLRLNVQRATTVTATAQSNTRVVVPVQARLGSGQVSLDLQLRSPSAIAIGGPERVTVNVRAEWEGVGITVLGVLVGGMVVLGAVRTVLRVRARRNARAVASGDDGDDEVTGG